MAALRPWYILQPSIHRAAAWLSLGGRLRPMSWWSLAPGPVAMALTLAFPARWLSFVGYAYLLLTAACYLWLRAAGPRLRLGRRLMTSWTQVGDDLEEQWDLANDSSLPLPWVELADDSTMPGYSARRVTSLAPGERLSWRTSARCDRRGVYMIGPLTARMGDPLGLFLFSWRERATRSVVIYPPLVRLPPLPMPFGRRGGLASADLLQIAATPSVGGLRDYAPGDPPSRIHWPSVARHGRLVIKEFDQERAGSLWIALDLSAAAYAPAGGQADDPAAAAQPAYGQSSAADVVPVDVRPDSLSDLAVILACSLAAAALAEGRSVGLLAQGGRRRIVRPAGGQQQLWRILGELVDAEPADGRPFGEQLRAELPAHGAATMVITPDLTASWVAGLSEGAQARQGGVLALLVTTSAARARGGAEALAAVGLPAQTFVLGDPLPLASPPRRRVKSRVSPLGRVIVEKSV